MKQYNGGNWAGLIADFKHNAVLAHKIGQKDNRSPEEKGKAHVRKAADFLSCFQCSQARKPILILPLQIK
jgi:hypothetical protein